MITRLQVEFDDFYATALSYLKKWFRISDYPPTTSWLLLQPDEPVKYEDVRQADEFLADPDIALEDALLDETSLLNEFLNSASEHFIVLPVDH